LVTPPGYTADSEWDDPDYPSFDELDKILCTMRLLQTHIYSKQRMPAARLVLQRQWKGGAATAARAMGVQAPLWFGAGLAALVARQAERDAESESDGDFDDDRDMNEELEEMIEAGLEAAADEIDEPFDPMRPPTPELVMTE
jgi:hypothetical protein